MGRSRFLRRTRIAAFVMMVASDEGMGQSSKGSLSRAGAAPPAHKNKPVEEAAIHSASAETDPEARP